MFNLRRAFSLTAPVPPARLPGGYQLALVVLLPVCWPILLSIIIINEDPLAEQWRSVYTSHVHSAQCLAFKQPESHSVLVSTQVWLSRHTRPDGGQPNLSCKHLLINQWYTPGTRGGGRYHVVGQYLDSASQVKRREWGQISTFRLEFLHYERVPKHCKN